MTIKLSLFLFYKYEARKNVWRNRNWDWHQSLQGRTICTFWISKDHACNFWQAYKKIWTWPLSKNFQSSHRFLEKFTNRLFILCWLQSHLGIIFSCNAAVLLNRDETILQLLSNNLRQNENIIWVSLSK